MLGADRICIYELQSVQDEGSDRGLLQEARHERDRKLYRELKEKEQAHYYILKINAGKYSFEHRSADIYKILDALNTAAETFGFEVERAQAMKLLVNMEFNDGLSNYAHRWGVTKVKGELKEEEER